MTNSTEGVAAGQLPEGLYELLTTELLGERLGHAAELWATFAEIDDGGAPDILSRHVSDKVRQSLAAARSTSPSPQPNPQTGSPWPTASSGN